MNNRILIIDDEEIVRDDIEEILSPRKSTHSDLSKVASMLFDSDEEILISPPTSRLPSFSITKASNGREGFDKVIRSLQENTPFAAIFLDMRMPGWDGLETAVNIREHDMRVEIIFLTAFSDRSIDDIVQKAGENVGYHCKPYASEEIIQLATKAVTDYNRIRDLEQLLLVVATISTTEYNLNTLLQNILTQLVGYLNTDSALLGKLHDDGRYDKLFSIGSLLNEINLNQLIHRIHSVPSNKYEVIQLEEMVFVRMDTYSIFALLLKGQTLRTDKLYLLKLFVQNATIAIQSAELHEKLLQKEKLSAIGQAMSMVMHDLRAPIGNIKMLTYMVREFGMDKETLDSFDKFGDQALAIMNDFLDFIREAPIQKKPVALNFLVADCIADMQKEERDFAIQYDVQMPDQLTVMGDESKLKRIILNLINNSREVLQSTATPFPKISIVAHDTAMNLMLQIRDNGPGIPEEIETTLFEPFITSRKANGTGLGLAIVKQFVTAHSGSIVVHSEGGAIFDITLPLT
ncbi:hybrid sensor histidine kinase/response regulator [Spirosoma spitsbergense]|uniref:hybrid sensor histidine kinase/response regulator n=1 Tax=Spirosoma spitsbergense TaxID=431554 RepID=UPI000373A333|nr:ATP-binding protein [Spirosoma spitsbergense]